MPTYQFEAMDATGHLTWEVPPGDWTIMRFGHTATGQHTGPAGPGSDAGSAPSAPGSVPVIKIDDSAPVTPPKS